MEKPNQPQKKRGEGGGGETVRQLIPSASIELNLKF